MALLPPLPTNVQPGTSWFNHWYEQLRSFVNKVTHNGLSGLQGGTTNEFYHLTSSQRTEVIATRSSRGVNTIDDVIIDLATKGLVLKDTQATPHYWRITINNTGTLVITDLGTTKP